MYDILPKQQADFYYEIYCDFRDATSVKGTILNYG